MRTYPQETGVLAIARAARVSRVSDRKALFDEIGKKLQNDLSAFRHLPVLAGAPQDSIRRYDPDGADVVVKFCGVTNTSGENMSELDYLAKEHPICCHGSAFKLYWRFFETFGRAASQDKLSLKNYALAPIETHGMVSVKIGRNGRAAFLVMDRMEPAEILSREHLENRYRATVEMTRDCFIVAEAMEREAKASGKRTGFYIPQLGLPIYLGNTNSQSPHKGRFVFALPHDEK